ncbi:11694_t:CDS:2, partial [Gigaspora rosea]
WPRTRPTIAEVLDTYSVPDKPEKKSSRDVALGLGIDLKPLQAWATEKEKYNRKHLDEKSKEEVVVKRDENKVSNICPKFVKAGNVDETDKSERIRIQNRNRKRKPDGPSKYQKIDDVTKTELDELCQKNKMKLENVPEDVIGEASREYQRSETKLDRKEEVVDKEDLEKNDCKTLVEVTQFKRKWNKDEKLEERNSYLNGPGIHIDPVKNENPAEPLSVNECCRNKTVNNNKASTYYHDNAELIKDKKGLREKIIPGMPSSYSRLYIRCWSTNPKKCPKLLEILCEIHKIKKNSKDIYNDISNRFL